MPNCSIRHCSSRKSKLQPKLTLHKFPSTGFKRNKWLDIIGIENLNPKHKSCWFVCSLHFDDECFNRTIDMTQIRLRDDAVPSLFIEAPKEQITISVSDDAVPTRSTGVCRVCLASGRRVYPLRALGLAATYSALSGAALLAGGPLPRGACAACALRLRAADRLAESSRRANQLLVGLMEKSFVITPEAINDLNRDDPALFVSALVPFHLEPNRFDLYIKEEEADSMKEENIKKETDGFDDYSGVEDNGDVASEVLKGPDVATEGAEDSVDMPDIAMEVVIEKMDTLVEEPTDSVEGPTEDHQTPQGDPPTEKRLKSTQRTAEDRAKRSRLIERYFSVQHLSLGEQIVDLGQAKLSSNYLEAKYKCDLCFKPFTKKATHGEHMKKHDESHGDFDCPVCHVRFKTRRTLRKHSCCHDSLFTCRACVWTTKFRTMALLHARWHRGTVYKCELCTEEVIFHRPTSLLSHLRLRHQGTSHCPLCGYSFMGEKGLHHHMVLKHAGETLPTVGPRCEECNVTFANEEACEKHQKVTHERCVRNEYCFPTDKSTRPRAGLKVAHSARNKAEPGGENSFSCDDCGERHASRPALQRHTRAAHGRSAPRRAAGPAAGRHGQRARSVLREQCHQCGRLFKCAAQLKDHMDAHTGSASHGCPECGKLFKTRSLMLMHRRGHTVRYLCPICKKEFNSSSNRDRHYTYVHSTVRDIKCEFCDKTFKCMLSRHQHEKYVHLDTPWPKRKRTKVPAQVES